MPTDTTRVLRTREPSGHTDGRWSRDARLVRHASVVAIGLLSVAASAQDRFTPYLSSQAEYNSNIFALPGHAEAAAENNGDRTLDDTAIRSVIGLDANVPIGDEKLRGTVEGRRLDYLHFDRLDHYEYLFSGGLDWRALTVVNGTLDYRQERRMASFADRESTQLSMENERIGNASVGVAISPEWRVEGGARSRELSTPLTGFPDFSLTENSFNTSIKYLGIDKLTTGLFAEYLSGHFDGITDAGDFSQETLAFVADYAIKDFQRFGLELGYTQRKDDNVPDSNLSGLTATLTYHRDLTFKTSVDLQAFRRVSSYIGGASSVEDLGAGAMLKWKTTDKLAVLLDYQFGTIQFKQTSATPDNQNRRDQSQVVSVKVDYQALPWLLVRPYAIYQVRDSNIDRNSFDAVIGGILLSARF